MFSVVETCKYFSPRKCFNILSEKNELLFFVPLLIWNGRWSTIHHNSIDHDIIYASMLSGVLTVEWNAFVSEAGGFRFNSRAGHIGRSAAKGSPPLQHFFERRARLQA